MATSELYAPLPNGEDQLQVSFDYINRDYVKLYSRAHADGSDQVVFSGALLVEGTHYTWLNGGTIELVTPADGATDFLLRRETPFPPLVEQQPGNLSSAKVNLAVKQALHVAEEAQARAEDTATQAGDILLRAVRAPSGETLTGMANAAARVGKFLVFDASGNPTLADGTGTDGSLRTQLASALGALLVGTLDGNLQDILNRSNHGVRAIPNPAFNYYPGRFIQVQGPGQAWTDVDIETEFRNLYLGNMGSEDWTGRAFVHPLLGDDTTGDGRMDAPFKTVKKALQTRPGLGNIEILPSEVGPTIIREERLDLRFADRTIAGGTAARPVVINAWGGKGSVIWTNPGQQPSEMTWTGGSAPRYKGTPATVDYGSGPVVPQAHSIVFRNGDIEVLVPYLPSTAAIDSRGIGWTQNAGTGEIDLRYNNYDMTNADKALFEINYSRPSASVFLGAKALFKGIIFRGLEEILVDYDGSNRPHFAAKDCEFQLSGGHGIASKGALVWLQDVVFDQNAGDGLNYYDRAGFPANPTEALEINVQATRSGPVEVKTVTTNPARNRQGSSGHNNTRVIRITNKREAVYALNGGQNIADTEETLTWMLGTIMGPPFGFRQDAGVDYPLYDGTYDNLHIEGEAWLDNVTVTDHGMTRYGLIITATGRVHHHNCLFSGVTAPVLETLPGTYTPYNPRTGLDL